MKNNIFKAFPKRAIWSIVFFIMATVFLALFIVTYNNFLDAVNIERRSTEHIGRTVNGLQLFYKIVLAIAIIGYINHVVMTAWMILNITYGIDSGRKQARWMIMGAFAQMVLVFFVLGFVGDVMEYGASWTLFALLIITMLIAPQFNKEIGTFVKGDHASLVALVQSKIVERKHSNIKSKN